MTPGHSFEIAATLLKCDIKSYPEVRERSFEEVIRFLDRRHGKRCVKWDGVSGRTTSVKTCKVFQDVFVVKKEERGLRVVVKLTQGSTVNTTHYGRIA